MWRHLLHKSGTNVTFTRNTFNANMYTYTFIHTHTYSNTRKKQHQETTLTRGGFEPGTKNLEASTLTTRPADTTQKRKGKIWAYIPLSTLAL